MFISERDNFVPVLFKHIKESCCFPQASAREEKQLYIHEKSDIFGKY